MKIRVLLPTILVAVTLIAASLYAGGNKTGQDAAKAVDDGILKYKAGDMDGALALFGQALNLQKDMPQAVYGKAAILFIEGKFGDATDVLQAYMANNIGDNFAWMWAYIASARNGNSDKATLTDMQAVTEENSWLGMTLPLFLGQTSPGDYIDRVKEGAATAGNMAGPELVRAQFMAAEAVLLNGDKTQAGKLFQAAADAPGSFQWEREMAKAELKRLKGGPAVESTEEK